MRSRFSLGIIPMMIQLSHHENLSVQYIDFSYVVKIENFSRIILMKFGIKEEEGLFYHLTSSDNILILFLDRLDFHTGKFHQDNMSVTCIAP